MLPSERDNPGTLIGSISNLNQKTFSPTKFEDQLVVIHEPSNPDCTILTEREYKYVSDEKPVPVMRNHQKILIVDDEKFNCDIIYGFMMILGVKNRSEIAEFAYNGEEAFSRV